MPLKNTPQVWGDQFGALYVTKTKIMCYKKDVFASFAYEFELLQLLVKSFACAHGEIKGLCLW